MVLTKTSVLAAALFLAHSALAATQPDRRADSESLLLEWNFPELQLETVHLQGQEWLQVRGDEAFGQLGQPGAPDLPVLNNWLQLPDRSGVQVTILDSEWEEYPGRILPEQERVHGENDFPPTWLQDQEIYSADGWFPGQEFQLGEPALLRNTRLAQLCLHPVQVNSEAGVTRVLRRIELRVDFEGQDLRNARMQAIAGESVLLKAITPSLIPAPGQSALRDLFDGVTFPGTYRVYAKTSAVANNAILQNLLNWKREKGHVVEVRTSSDISWNATSIRNDISAAYFNSPTPPDYVLLIGDPTESSGSDYWLPCGDTSSDGDQDHYYAMIDGNDVLGDVAVGRFSVTSSSQLQAVANKVLAYETAPQTAEADMGWLERAALAVGYDALSMRQQSQTIIDDMVANGMNPGEIATRYGGTSDQQLSWVNSQFVNGIGLYNYRGWIGMNGVSASSVSNSSNFTNSYRTPVAAIFTCSTGDFNNGTSTTEAFLRKGSLATPQGAVAAMGFATSQTHTAYNNAVCGGFWGAFLDLGLDQIGPAMFYGKYTLVNNLPPGDSNASAFSRRANLMGDPGMDMWVGVPPVLDVELADGGNSIPYGTSVIELEVTADGSPAEGITVCLFQNGQVFQRGLSDANGRVWLDASGAQTGTLRMTASRSRHLPDRDALSVTAAGDTPEISALGIAGDGLAAPGESVTLFPTVTNNGNSLIINLSLGISLDPALGTATDASCSWPSIPIGATVASSDPVIVTLNGGLSDGDNVLVDGFFETPSRDTWDQAFLLPVSAPELLQTDASFNPGGSIINPGSSATLTVDLANLGGLDATSLQLTLGEGGDPFLGVTNGVYNGFSAAAGGSSSAQFTVSAAGNSLRGHVAQLPLDWSGGGLNGSTTVSVTIGSPNSAAPTGPDAYGYYAIENEDFHSLSPDYNWIDVEGGGGTWLNLGDNGDEQDAATLVSLPFTFQYYGVEYTQMAVCSNGFVAFEDGAELQHDFRNHYFPTSLGPDAMIGVNWDDHKSSGSNGVYVQSIPAQHIYVVEWHQMQHNPSGGSNTFQLILYDPDFYPTPTGDGPFKMQYAAWNNTQSGNTDFNYCSVGIKDHDSAVGLTLTNFNQDAATVQGFQAGRAVYFTTEAGVFDDSDTTAPIINVIAPGVVEPDEMPMVSAALEDQSGIDTATLSYSTDNSSFTPLAMSFQGGQTWAATLPGFPLGTTVWYYITAVDLSDNSNSAQSATYSFTVADGDPPTCQDGYGYCMYDTEDAVESRDFNWVDISGLGSGLSLGDDGASVVTLPFPFTYYGTDFSQIAICSNGFVNLGSTSYTAYSNQDMADGDGTANQICPLWDDLNPSQGGEVRYWHDSAGARFVISWIDVPHYFSSNPETFQVILYDESVHETITDDSPFQFQYLTAADLGDCTVGHQNSGRNDGNSYLYNNSYDSNAATIAAGQSIWITTGTYSEPPLEPLDPITDLSILHAGSNVILSWTAIPDADFYEVYSDTDPYGEFGVLLLSTPSVLQVLPSPGADTFYQVLPRRNEAALRAGTPAAAPVRILRTIETHK